MLLLMFVFCTSGASCSRSIRSPFAPWTPPAPEVLATGSSLDQVIAAVNQNSARIQSLQTNNASITVPGMPAIPLLRGNIAAQRPGRIRLIASTLIGPEVDLGANDELFWFWVKHNEPPAIYFARHDQFCGTAAQKLLPIEPQWLLDALGFVEFKPNDRHEGPVPAGKGRVEIKSLVQGRCGPMTKRTVIDSHSAGVLEQHVYDGAGTLVASAVAKGPLRYYPGPGVLLPEELEIRVPASNLSMSIDLGTVEINTIAENPQLWTMPVISGAPPTDLGATPVANGVQRLGDQLTRGDWYGPGPATGAPAPIQPASAIAPAAVALQTAPAPGAAPQFISPGGIAQAPANVAQAPPGMQRLPSGGLPTGAALAR
jgi:hypothetical protein